jgi:hypothetical protein
MSNAIKMKYKDHNNYALIGTNDVLYVEQSSSADTLKIWYNVITEAGGKVMSNEITFGVNITAEDVKALQNLIKRQNKQPGATVPVYKLIGDDGSTDTYVDSFILDSDTPTNPITP